MSNKEILKYIKNQLEQEVERSFIEKNLIEKGGWNKKDVDEAFNELRGSNNMDEQIPKAKKSREESDYVKSESTERLSNNKNKGKVNFTKTFILTATILLLSGGAVFGYFKFFKRPDPDIMLRKAFSNLSEVDSYAYESDMNFSLKSKDGDSLSLIVGSDGVSNVESSLENMKSKHNINLNIAIKSKGNSGMMSIGANFEVRVLDGVVYLLVNQSPSFGLMDLSGIEKQWISLNSTEDVSDSNSLLGLKTENPFSEENREHIKEFVLENPLVKVAEDLGSEEINGEDAYHYRMRVDRENVILLAKEINKLAEEKQEMNTVDIKDLENFLDDQGNDIRGDVWVSESKELPIKIGLNISSVIEEQKKAKENVNNMIASVMGAFPQGDNLSNSSFPQIPEISEYSLRVEIQFSDFNKPVKVLAPKNVQKLEDVLQEMFGFGPGAMGAGSNNGSIDFLGLETARKKSRDARRVSDIKQLSLALELYYDKNHHYPDSIYGNPSPLVAGNYMYNIPKDPKDDSEYYYAYPGHNPTNYHIGVRIEDVNNNSLEYDDDFNSKNAGWKGKTFNGVEDGSAPEWYDIKSF